MARKFQVQNNDELMTIRGYLSSYSPNRGIDNTIIKWCAKRDNTNPKKSKESWDAEIKIFFGETEQY